MTDLIKLYKTNIVEVLIDNHLFFNEEYLMALEEWELEKLIEAVRYYKMHINAQPSCY
jgi:hypothetical protein